MMTRKDYKIIAQALHDAADLDDAVVKIAKALDEDNPRFNLARFYAAVDGVKS